MKDTPSSTDSTPKNEPKNKVIPEPLCYTIQDFHLATSISQTTLYADIKSGRLKTRMLGGGKRKKHLILKDDGMDYLKSFPSMLSA